MADARTVGYVGTVNVETHGVSRLWFSLTRRATGSEWVKIGRVRAWFTMNLESADRPSHMAQLTLLLEAMRNGLQVKVTHGGAARFRYNVPQDSFEVTYVRILRKGLRF